MEEKPQEPVYHSYHLKMHGSRFANGIAHVSVAFGEILTFEPNFSYRYNDLREEKTDQSLFDRVAIRSA
jgi:hypothetical protein